MELGLDLSQKQTLKLTLTPELQQSINILKYSSIELIDFLYDQANDNPLLEINEKNNQLLSKSNDSYNLQDSFHFHKTHIHSINRDMNHTFDHEYYNPIQNYSLDTETLEKHLMEQMTMLRHLTKTQQDILRFLIGSLNEQGYLDIEATHVAHIFSISLKEVEAMISILQSFDPVGVGAKNLTNCLLIQLRALPAVNELVYAIVENHLHDIAEKRYRKLASIFDVTPQEIQAAVDHIRTLNPRPASHFNKEITNYIIPDVIVEKINGENLIIINDSFIPNLSINDYYQKIIQNIQLDSTQPYLKDKFNEATMLLKGIDQRNLTMYKVTEAILKKQKEFFNIGLKGLKPMKLKDISEELNLHESTISRATSNKFIQTSHGLFKIKNLFTRGMSQNQNQQVDSLITIKNKLKSLINQENQKNPYSDQKITNLLEETGIKISRRTVAKYREQLGIPGSTKRVRY